MNITADDSLMVWFEIAIKSLHANNYNLLEYSVGFIRRIPPDLPITPVIPNKIKVKISSLGNLIVGDFN